MGDTALELAGFVPESIVDGPGIRAAVFVQGCPHACPGCHNPQSHAFGIGTKRSVQALYAEIRRNPLVHGVTFSGGEPFCQPEPLARLAKLLHADGYETACYTGYTLETLLSGAPAQQALLAQLDILIDGPFVLAQRSLALRFRGSTNQRILDMPASLAAQAAVWSKQPRWLGED